MIQRCRKIVGSNDCTPRVKLCMMTNGINKHDFPKVPKANIQLKF